MNKAHVIDIETGGIAETAHIYSVAIVTVDLDLPIEEMFLHWEDTALSEEQPSRTFNEKTLSWWANQSETAKKWAMEREFKYEIKPVLSSLADLLQKQPYPIWGNGSDFDNRILAHAFAQYGFEWPYQLNRCLRTLKNVGQQINPNLVLPEFIGTRHIALDDAKHEARVLKVLTDTLKARR